MPTLSPPPSSSSAASAPPTPPIITRADFIRALKRELPDAIDDIRKAGVGPVDMQQSVIGPGMGVFSRYAKVLEDDDSAMSVRTALALINRVWEEIENELDTSFRRRDAGRARLVRHLRLRRPRLGRADHARQRQERPARRAVRLRRLQGPAGQGRPHRRARAAGRTGRPPPTRRLTVWECVQHTARVLNAEDGGGEAAARLVAQMGPKAAEARALAYRLFEIATKRAGPPRRWSTTSSPRNGRSSRTWRNGIATRPALTAQRPGRVLTSSGGTPDVGREGRHCSGSSDGLDSICASGLDALRRGADEGASTGRTGCTMPAARRRPRRTRRSTPMACSRR